MAGAWAEEMRRELPALVRRFSGTPSAVADEGRLVVAAWEFHSITLSHNIQAQPPSGAEAAELLRLLRQLGTAVAAWDAPLLRRLQQGQQGATAMLQAGEDVAVGGGGPHFLAACLAALTGVRVARILACSSAAALDSDAHAGRILACSSAAALDICRPAGLLFGSGRQAAQNALAAARLFASGVQRDRGRGIDHGVGAYVTLQVRLLEECIQVAGSSGETDTFVRRLVPPQPFADWLAAVIAVLQSGLKLPPEHSALGLLAGWKGCSSGWPSSRPSADTWSCCRQTLAWPHPLPHCCCVASVLQLWLAACRQTSSPSASR
ncbi:hypothetical protein ABPG75_000203 [Micractinium tetrahymenae]